MRTSTIPSIKNTLPARRRIFSLLAAVFAGLLASLPARAATMTWGAATTDSGNTDVLNVGASLYGFYAGGDGNSNTDIVNGVTFSGSNGNGTLTFPSANNVNTSAFTSGAAPFSNLSTAYQNLLAGAVYNLNTSSVTVTLNALTSGHVYVTQFWVSDPRGSNRTDTLTSAGGNSVTLSFDASGLNGGLGQYALGGFIASGTTQAFTVTGNQIAQINAVQVRDVSGVWSGAVNGNWDSSTANFTAGESFSTVSGLVNTVYFADTDGFGNAVTNSNITVQSGGVSIGNVVFQNNAVNYTLNSSDANGISGSTVVTLSGTGTVTLNGTNTFSGATTISSGKLQLGNANAVENSTVTINVANGLAFTPGVGTFNLGSLSGSGSEVLADTGGSAVTLSVGANNSSPTTYSGVLSGSGGLTKAGSGQITLSGNNSYTGSTTVSSGTLQLTGSLGQGAYSSAITDNGTILVNANQTFSGPVAGSGALSVLGNTLTLSGSNTFAGGTTISGGKLQLGNANAVQNSTVTVNAANGLTFSPGIGTFNLGGLSGSSNEALADTGGAAVSLSVGANNSNPAAYSGVLSGSGGLTIVGNGVVTLTGNNTYTGATTISSGTLQIGSGSTAGSLASNSITDNGSLVYSRSDTINLSGTISGTGTLTLNAGAGTIGVLAPINVASVTATSSYTSTVQNLYGSSYGTAINLFANVTTAGNQTYNGIVSIGHGSTNPTVALTATGGGSIVLANGVVSGLSGYGTAGILTLNTSAGNGNVTLGGQSGSYGVGNLNINSGTGTITLTGGAYDYDYSVFNGNVAVTGSTGFSNPLTGGQFSINGLTFNGNLTGAGNTLTASFGGGSVGSTLASGTAGLIFNNNATTQQVSVNLAGTAGPTIVGGGVTIFSGTDTYTGATVINSGTLQIGNGGAGGSIANTSGVSGSSGGKLAFNLSSSGTFAPSITGGIGLNQGGSGTLILNNAADNYSGATTVSSGTLGLQDTTSFASTTTVNSGGGTLVLNRTANGLANRNSVSGLITGSGMLNITSATSGIGGGWVTFSNASHGLSNFTGTVNVTSGVLAMDNSAGAWSGNPELNVLSGGLFALRSQSISVDALTGNGDVFNSNSSATSTLTVGAANGSGTFSGVIHGNSTGSADGQIEQGLLNLVKSGTGTEILTGANTYAGTTTVNAGGALQIGGAGSLGTSGTYAGNITNNGTFVYNSSANATFTGVLSGSGSLTQSGASTLLLTGNNTSTGSLTISSGTLQIGAGGNTGSLANPSITDNASLVYSRSDSIGITGTISGTGSLTLNGGAGTIGILSPINLASVTATSSFASSVQSNYGSSYASAINLFANVTTSGNQIYNGIVSIGAGTSATAATVLTTTSGGSVSLPNGALGGFSGDFSSNQLWIDTSAGNGNVTLGGQSALEYGVGNLSINSGTGTITLTGGSYYYDFSIFNGNVALTGSTTFQNDGQRYVRGVMFNGNLSGPGTLTATLNGGGAAGTSGTGVQGLIFNTATTQLVSANIAGGSGPTKAGTGTTIFSGSDSYTGATTINSGTLIVSGSLSGTASVSATGGSTLEVDGLLNHSATTSLTGGELQGTGSVGAVTLANASTIAPGYTAASGFGASTALNAGSVTFSDTASTLSLGIGIVSGSDNTQLASGGTVTLDKTPLQLTLGNTLNNASNIGLAYVIITGGAGATGSGFDVFSYGGTALANTNTFTTSGGFTFEVLYGGVGVGTNDIGNANDVELVLTAVPEPGTWATIALGFGMLVGLQRRRRLKLK